MTLLRFRQLFFVCNLGFLSVVNEEVEGRDEMPKQAVPLLLNPRPSVGLRTSLSSKPSEATTSALTQY